MISQNLAISVKSLSKLYRIGVNDQTYDDLGHALWDFVKSPLDNYRKYRSLYDFSDVDLDDPNLNNSSILALRDISFDVSKGEVVGIVGTNGAGKSTLLKVLSKITPPTKGSAEIRGRVSSLLEVGTGFHQELTGRENVYLNGTILGMRKKEVDQKFDEIVAFSGVEKFLDTPVKRYSSGMRVRLAFAVAAHLDPEILIIDEVLAVGDASFQKQCMSKMHDVGQYGKTVLFVSHNMAAVSQLCTRAIWINEGRMVMDGLTNEVVDAYSKAGLGTKPMREWPNLDEAPGDDVVRLCSLRAKTPAGHTQETMDVRQSVGIEMEFEVLKDGSVLFPYYVITNSQGLEVFSAIDQDSDWRSRTRPAGHYISTAWIPENLLSEGILYVSPAMRALERRVRHFNEKDVISFNMVDPIEGDSARGNWTGRLVGVVRPLLKWETLYQSESKAKAAG